MEFPIFSTKIKGLNKKFDLTKPEDQKRYFELKAGKEIEKLREFLKENTFVAYLLGKKNSGKGTYSKMFAEIVLPEKIEHFSIGDMVRKIDEELKDEAKKKELISFLEKNYRGPLSVEEIIQALEQRSTQKLLPTELILALVKREMEKREKKTLFIDGFPRDLDQVSFSLFFRDLIGYRYDPDVFILIDVPNTVIDARIKWRRVCPKCQTPRNLKLLPTSRVGYDKEKKEFYLICDNCGERMVQKEGDELGIEPIRERLEKDEELIKKALNLYGIPKVLLRNSIPLEIAKESFDDYEITPEYYFEIEDNEVKIKEKPWTFLDDQGRESVSLLPQPVVVSLIKQLVEIFNL
jgi:adenylate kinase family enzyme